MRSAVSFHKNLIVLLGVLGFLCGYSLNSFGASSPKDLFNKANDAYLEGKYEVAVGLYERLALHRKIVHEDLFYNLGNAYFKLGKLGYAIYNYEKALKVAPNFTQAKHNLDLAREIAVKQAGDKVVGAIGEPFWVRTVKFFTPLWMSVWFLVFWYLCFGMLVFLFFLKKGVFRVLAASGSGLFGVAALLFGLLLVGRAHYDKNMPEGVVLQKVVEVREGPRSNAVSSFKIHHGLKVRLLEADMEWYKIQLANGLEGWVERRTIGKL